MQWQTAFASYPPSSDFFTTNSISFPIPFSSSLSGQSSVKYPAGTS
jgi:hypothetical protein